MDRLVVDEAHCVDKWGKDFRPSYSNLCVFKEHKIQIVAFTGTATDMTVHRIVDSLKPANPSILRMPIDRPNLSLKVVVKRETKSMEQVAEIVTKNFSGLCGIVYCFSTRDALDIAYHLKQRGVKAVYYHGQLDLFERSRNSEMWLEGRSDVMCSTNAFGMGIDKSNVRFVIHHSMPKSMEEYFQEAGRAGRDGNSSSYILLFRFADRTKVLKHISDIEDEAHEASTKKNLDEMLKYFGDSNLIASCGSCDNCLCDSTHSVKDMTSQAIDLINCVVHILTIQAKVPTKMIIKVYRGHKTKDVVEKGLHTLPMFGKGKAFFRNDKGALELLHMLIAMGFLRENLHSATDPQTTPFITVEEHSVLLNGEESIQI